MTSKHDAALTRQIAAQIGIPAEVFSEWDGSELALYEDASGVGSTLEIARRNANRKALLLDWTLDLGNRVIGLPQEQGASLRQKLEEAGIPFAHESQGGPYVERIHQIATANADVLRELAKR